MLKDVGENYSRFSPQFISATTDYGIEKLKKEVEKAVVLT